MSDLIEHQTESGDMSAIEDLRQPGTNIARETQALHEALRERLQPLEKDYRDRVVEAYREIMKHHPPLMAVRFRIRLSQEYGRRWSGLELMVAGRKAGGYSTDGGLEAFEDSFVFAEASSSPDLAALERAIRDTAPKVFSCPGLVTITRESVDFQERPDGYTD